MKLNEFNDFLDSELSEAVYFPEPNKKKKTPAQEAAKKLFMELIDEEIISGGMENLYDNLDEIPEDQRDEVERIITSYIKRVKAFIEKL